MNSSLILHKYSFIILHKWSKLIIAYMFDRILLKMSMMQVWVILIESYDIVRWYEIKGYFEGSGAI